MRASFQRLALGDAFLTASAAAAAVYLVAAARWTQGFAPALVTFAVIAAGPPVLRGLAARYPRVWAFDLAASFWLLPASIFGHFALAPLVDASHPRLLDRYLALADLRLFGAHPSVLLDGAVSGPALDLLFVCYYSYFVLPFAVGVLLYVKDRARFDELICAMALLFVANFALYVAVPAVGPRYFLADLFHAPLRGGPLTPWLDSLMRQPGFAADCFPSGHTAVTLTALAFAYRHSRRLFLALLPVGMGLVAATLVCRFHYGVDLLCAVPLAAACLAVAWQAAHAAERRAVRAPAWIVRTPAKA